MSKSEPPSGPSRLPSRGPSRPLSASQRQAAAVGTGAVIARLRLRAAQLVLPALPASHTDLLERWLQSLPLPSADLPREPLEALGLQITGDLQRITWFAAGDPATFIPPMAHFLEGLSVAEDEMERLGAAGAAVEPAVLGSFLESRADGMNAGWFFPGRAGFRSAAGQIDHAPLREALLRWSAEYPAVEVLGFGRAMGAGDPYTRLTLSLPQETAGDLSQALPAAVALFDALEAPLPPDAALDDVRGQPPTALGVSLWLAHDGLIKAGLVAWEPSLALVIALAQQAGLTGSLDALAQIQGLLDVNDAAAVELQTRVDGYGIELFYELL